MRKLENLQYNVQQNHFSFTPLDVTLCTRTHLEWDRERKFFACKRIRIALLLSFSLFLSYFFAAVIFYALKKETNWTSDEKKERLNNEWMNEGDEMPFEWMNIKKEESNKINGWKSSRGVRMTEKEWKKGNNVLENILNISKRKIQLKPNEETLETNCLF